MKFDIDTLTAVTFRSLTDYAISTSRELREIFQTTSQKLMFSSLSVDGYWLRQKHVGCERIKMSNPKAVFEYRDESQADRLARKSKDSPFMIIGILGLIGVCGFGAYKYKTKGKMSTSVFLMQLRVAAQGTVVSALTIGLAYTLVKEHLLKDDKKKE
nr:HIG1 domain family member 1A, mitochondrial-like [Helicoverpa armigera]